MQKISLLAASAILLILASMAPPIAAVPIGETANSETARSNQDVGSHVGTLFDQVSSPTSKAGHAIEAAGEPVSGMGQLPATGADQGAQTGTTLNGVSSSFFNQQSNAAAPARPPTALEYMS